MVNISESFRITSPYGWRVDPIRGGREFHSGVDLVKADQAPIHVFTEGNVLFAGMGMNGTGLGGYGNVVVVMDKNGHAHLYAHLARTTAAKGDVIKKGQMIGFQGATGKVTGSHLHYEVRKKSAPAYGWTAHPAQSTLNPVSYLPSGLPATRKKLILSPEASSWRVYPMGKKPVKGNEVGFLNPKKFAGLQYDIIGYPQKDVYTIQTADFGKVNIYAAPATGAIIK